MSPSPLLKPRKKECRGGWSKIKGRELGPRGPTRGSATTAYPIQRGEEEGRGELTLNMNEFFEFIYWLDPRWRGCRKMIIYDYSILCPRQWKLCSLHAGRGTV